CLLFALLMTGLFACGALAELKPLPLDDDTAYGYELRQENFISDTEYRDESLHVALERFQYNNVNCIQATVKIADPSQIRTAKSSARFDDQEMVKAALMGKKANAVLAVNGDFFKQNAFGYTIRQCYPARKRLQDKAAGRYDVLMIDNMGDFHTVRYATEESAQAKEDELAAQGRFVVNSFTFGPVLVLDGQKQEFDQWMWQADDKAQRIAVAQVDELTYMIFQCDGSTQPKRGMTLSTFANMMLSRCDHIRVAYNLDGGGSCNVVFNGKKINANRDVRQICDILYFASIDASGEEP
ncbi:MAG: phosphodiester glycosidase family protein, partial [Clostridia bacterium]|nr:phosphodiester glycosidase family protein [Clostridia bacterium]